MNSKHMLSGLVLLAMAACSSGDDSGTQPANKPPVVAFTSTVLAVPTNSLVTLNVTASDPDGDPLVMSWSFTRQPSFTYKNAQKTSVEWMAPATVGADTVTIQADDGTVTTTLRVEVKVATRRTLTTLTTNFTKASAPYILDSTGPVPLFTVPGNATVNIEAGVEIFLQDPETHISVLGNLEAHGTADEPIVIRPNNRTFNCTDDRGWWEGISAASDEVAVSDGLVDLEHVTIRDAKYGVRLIESSQALIRDCEILCTSEAGVQIEGAGSLRVFDSRITDGAKDGIAIVNIVLLPDSVRIEGCNLSFNGNAGIRMDLNDVGQVVPIKVEYNQIEFNGAYGILLSNSVFPSIHYNAFRGNGDSSVASLYLTIGYPDPVNQPTLDATCNYWGAATTSQATIDQSIHDKLDTIAVKTRVTSCPWLNTTPYGAATPPNCSMTCP